MLNSNLSELIEGMKQKISSGGLEIVELDGGFEAQYE